MKVRNLKRLIKEQSDRLSIKGASIKITKDGIIVETAINNDMRKVNGLATLVKSYLVAEGLKIDGFNINKAGNAIKSKYFISEAVFQEDEDNEEEIVPTHVASTEIDIYDPEPEEVMEDPMADLSDEEYVKAVVGEVDYSKVPDDEESIEIAINDDLDSFFDDGAEETITVDVNAHNGEGPLSERVRMNRASKRKSLNEGWNDAAGSIVRYLNGVGRSYGWVSEDYLSNMFPDMDLLDNILRDLEEGGWITRLSADEAASTADLQDYDELSDSDADVIVIKKSIPMSAVMLMDEASTPSGRGEEYMLAIGKEWMDGKVVDHDEYRSIKKIKFSASYVEEAIAYVYAMADIAYQSTLRKPSRDEVNEWLSNNSFSPEDPNFEVVLDEINEKFAEEYLAVVSLQNVTTGTTLIENGDWKGPKNGKGWITKDEFDSLPESRKNPTRKKTMVKEASGNPYGDHYTADRWIYKTGQGGWWMEYDTTDSFWAKSDLMALKKLALMKSGYEVSENGYKEMIAMLKETTSDATGAPVDFSDKDFWIDIIQHLGDEEIAYANLTSPNGTVFQDDDYKPGSPMVKKWERAKKLSQQTPENDWDDSIDEIEEDI